MFVLILHSTKTIHVHVHVIEADSTAVVVEVRRAARGGGDLGHVHAPTGRLQ